MAWTPSAEARRLADAIAAALELTRRSPCGPLVQHDREEWRRRRHRLDRRRQRGRAGLCFEREDGPVVRLSSEFAEAEAEEIRAFARYFGMTPAAVLREAWRCYRDEALDHEQADGAEDVPWLAAPGAASFTPARPPRGRGAVVQAIAGVALVLALVRPAAGQIAEVCGPPTITAVASEWNEPTSWAPARLPTEGDTVIVPAGVAMVYELQADARLACVLVEGELSFAPDSRLVAGTIHVRPTGTLRYELEPCQTADGAPPARCPTIETVFADLPPRDAERYGTGLIVEGTWITKADRREPFFRLAAPALAGQTAITVEPEMAYGTKDGARVVPFAASGWRPGDELIVPDSRPVKAGTRWERPVIDRIEGTTIHLRAPLQFDHPGRTGKQRSFLPHVGNLSRPILFRSATPAGTRGHIMVTHHGRASVEDARFQDLGRTTVEPTNPTTNPIGRYAVHFHQPMTRGNTFRANAVIGTSKWGVALHGTHGTLVQGNVIFDAGGSGIVTEDGSESFNRIEHNFVVNVWGKGGRSSFGREGIGFWFRGVHNYIVGNVAANCRSISGDVETAYGFEFLQRDLLWADILKEPDGEPVRTWMPGVPILMFRDNEAYGSEGGFTYWWIGTRADQPVLSAPWSVVEDLRIWNTWTLGIYHYQAHHLLLRHVTVLPQPDAMCFFPSDYIAHDVTLSDFHCDGARIGIEIPRYTKGGTFRVEGAYLRTRRNVWVRTPWTVSADTSHIGPRHAVLTDIESEALPGQPLVTLLWSPSEGLGTSPVTPDTLVFNGARVFSVKQAADEIVPAIWREEGGWRIHRTGCPEENLTNAECDARYGVKRGDEIATCALTDPAFPGAFVCPSDLPVPRLTGKPILTEE